MPEVWANVYDKQANLLTSTAVLSHTNSSWTTKSTTLDIPTTAAKIQIRLKGTRNSGTDNDSYIDSISLTLTHQDINQTNIKPVAVVNHPSTAQQGETITLDANASYDSDNSPLALMYRWIWANRPAGSTAELSSSDAVAVDLMVDMPSIYHVTLEVSDGKAAVYAEAVIDVSQAALTLCDVNGDDYVDNNDILAIQAKLNTSAGANDPADLDANGVIDNVDLAACQLQCTSSDCQTTP